MQKNRQAVMAFSQSEKIKAGLIWASQLIQAGMTYAENDRVVADKMMQILTAMVANEVSLARRVAHDTAWDKVDKNIEKALVMMRSGVSHEATHHLTQALTHVTDIGQRSLSFLNDNDYI